MMSRRLAFVLMLAGCGGSTPGHDASVDSGRTVCPSPNICARDPFVPPFATLGVPGWQQSSGEICVPHEGDLAVASVGFGGGSVFALVGTYLPLESPSSATPGFSLLGNDGSGWQVRDGANAVAGMPPIAGGLAVDAAGTVYLQANEAPDGSPCSLVRIDATGTSSCVNSSAIQLLALDTAGVPLIYGTSAIERYDAAGSSWVPLFTVPPSVPAVTDLWSDGTTTILVGTDASAVRFVAGGSATALSGAPAGNYLTIAGRSATNLYIGTDAGQVLRFDGSVFHPIDLGLPNCGLTRRVNDLWVDAAGDVFVAADRGIVHIDAADQVTFRASWSCDVPVAVKSVTGSDARSERYYALENLDDAFRTCGPARLLVENDLGFRLF